MWQIKSHDTRQPHPVHNKKERRAQRLYDLMVRENINSDDYGVYKA